MKVVMSAIRVHPFHKYGGAEIYIYNLAKYLVKNGVKVKIITSAPEGIKIRNTNYEGIKYEFIQPYVPTYVKGSFLFYHLIYHLFNFNLARKLSKEDDFDILHSYGMTAYRYLKRTEGKNRVIVQPFGLYYGSHELKVNIVKGFLSKILRENPVRFCLKHSNAIATEGDIQAKEISEKFKIPEEKFFNIPDGIEIEIIEEYLRNSRVNRREFNLYDADIVLANVNRLDMNKGVDYLIEALKRLNEDLNVKLILIGAGPEENAIKQKIRSLGLESKVVHFKDISDEEKFQLIDLADISVTPTLFEGLPIVILEAMACGKPIVASNVTEVPQVVKHGKNGFLVPPRDPEAIAKAVLEIYEKGLTDKMGVESKKMAKDYNWDIIAKKAIRKYEDLKYNALESYS